MNLQKFRDDLAPYLGKSFNPFALSTLIFIAHSTLVCCSGRQGQVSQRIAEQASLAHSLEKLKPQANTSKSLFIAEGSKSPSTRCDDKSSVNTELIARYIAKLQGGKAVVKESCFAEGYDRDLRTLLPQENCVGRDCGVYEVYRRGPLWFSLFMASFNAALSHNEVRIFYSNLEEGNESSESTVSKSIFRAEDHETAQRQLVRFTMGKALRCIAHLKLYHSQVTLDRVDGLDELNRRFSFTHSPSAGELFAEHRAKVDERGYEVLIVERRLAKEHEGGEVLERELLCESDSEPINLLNEVSQFSWIDFDRDTTRVFAHPLK